MPEVTLPPPNETTEAAIDRGMNRIRFAERVAPDGFVGAWRLWKRQPDGLWRITVEREEPR